MHNAEAGIAFDIELDALVLREYDGVLWLSAKGASC